MKKKMFFMILISLVVFLNLTCLAVDSENIEINAILKNNNIIEETFITRRDCLVSIMKIIGVTNDLEIDIHTEKYFSDCSDTDIIYFSNAIYKNIAVGTRKLSEYEYEFKPDRCATYNDVLAFIVRCLTSETENIVEEAIKLGIIKETDSFYNDLDGYITNNEFYMLLERMLMKKCYIYVGKDVVNPQSKTYLDILKERQEIGVTAKSYSIVDMIRNAYIAGNRFDNLAIKYVFD